MRFQTEFRRPERKKEKWNTVNKSSAKIPAHRRLASFSRPILCSSCLWRCDLVAPERTLALGHTFRGQRTFKPSLDYRQEKGPGL